VTASTPDTVHVVETSSFQLEEIETFHPWIAVMLNFSPDHLDRHPTVEAYAAAKAESSTTRARGLGGHQRRRPSVLDWRNAPARRSGSSRGSAAGGRDRSRERLDRRSQRPEPERLVPLTRSACSGPTSSST
jgi:UDP-N-acetylmuramoylalanine-D-glutamate ligase